MGAKVAVFDFDNITEDCELEEIKVYARYRKPNGERYEMIKSDFTVAVTYDTVRNNEKAKQCCATCQFFDYECSPLDGPTGHCTRVSSEYYSKRTRVDFTCDDWAVKEDI